MIRVGRITGSGDHLTYPDFKSIVVLMKNPKYGDIGPYHLCNSDGQIMENIWQFSKVYKTVPRAVQLYSRYDNTVTWDHPSEVHVDEHGNILPAYFDWRNKGFNNQYYVRYPVGQQNMNKCLYALWNGEKLDYISSRKKIYVPEKFNELKQLLASGVNLLILEPDGPREESLQYYKDTYGVSDNFIDKKTMLATKENLRLMLNDTKHSYGHGYCLASALLDLDQELCS
jgi:hypothetical protein